MHFINFKYIASIISPFMKTILILLVGHFVAVYIRRIVKKAFKKSNVDISLAAFLTKTINISLHLIVILSALNSLGISTTGIVAALSAATLAIAVALKDSLSNVAGGVLLLISPRFVTGDFIETEGDSGKVLSVDLLHTIILTPDNKQVSIPNGVLINSHIINYSREKLRRLDLIIPVPYSCDIEYAKDIIKKTILLHPSILKEPAEPLVRVKSYSSYSVDVLVRIWCSNDDYWNVNFDLTEEIRNELKSNNIDMPFEQLDVHIKND